MIEIPRSKYGKGARKAQRAMRKRYGKKKGDQVFYARANKLGRRGMSRARKVTSVYKKGGTQKKRRSRRRR